MTDHELQNQRALRRLEAQRLETDERPTFCESCGTHKEEDGSCACDE